MHRVKLPAQETLHSFQSACYLFSHIPVNPDSDSPLTNTTHKVNTPKLSLLCFARKSFVPTFVIGLLLSFQSAFGLVSTYSFASTAGNYIALSGATVLFTGGWDDGISSSQTIPFSFNYNGTNYTTLTVSSNGFITLGGTATLSYCGLQQSPTNSIAAYGTDLVGASAGSTVSCGVRGSSPNRQYVIQWSDVDHWGNSNQDHWTFQLILNETSNSVQVVWGTSTDVITFGANTCADTPTESGNVGLLGASTADFNIRKILNGTQTWSSSIAGTSLTDVCNISPTNIPALGTTYTWTPGAAVPMTFVSSTTTFLNNSQALSAGSSGNQILQVQVVTSGTTSPFTVNSLTLSTTGCTNASADISNAKVYFSGNSNSFVGAVQFGSTFTGPNGSYTVSGTATLSEGTNYFWITYDIKPTAILNDLLSGCCTQVVGTGTMGTRTPTVTCPAGSQNVSSVGTWTPLATLAPNANSGVMLVLSDGTVICKTSSGGSDGYGNVWNKLTPDITGSYVNGTWSSIAPMNNTRLYFSSQVLKDGRVYVAGGEYGTGLATGEVYDPIANTWTPTPSPTANVSDANSAILEDGRVMQALVAGTLRSNVIYNPATNTYTAGPSCIGIHNESTWVKLPDNSILFIDRLSTASERYIPATNTWVSDGTVPASLYDPFGLEFGTGLLLPDGRAFFVGSTGKTAYYTPSGNASPGVWTLGPDVPSAKGQPDAPGAMMVNGKILLAVSPVPISSNHFPTPTTFYEFNYLTNTYTLINAPGGTASLNISCYQTNFTDLPDGTVLYSNQGSSQYYVYTPAGSPLAAGKPVINTLTALGCNSYQITGNKFNGISEGACYGDDWQMATNYPIIRLSSGGNVYYVRTSNWNSTGVQRGSAADTTYFTIPAGVPAGTYSLVVTANGIASDPTSITISGSASLTSTLTPGSICSGTAFTYTPQSNISSATFTWTRAFVSGITNDAITIPQTVNPNEVLVNTTSTPLNVTYTYVINGTGCTTNTQSVTVTVLPITAVITNAAISSTQCANSALSIPFTAGCAFTAGNIFTAQLSNASGSFASPTTIGTLTGTGSGTINALIPIGASGSGYRIRIVTSSPVTTSADNGSNISISACSFTFNVKLLIQGFYTSSGQMRATINPTVNPTVCDTVRIELHNASSPYSLVDNSIGTINTGGLGAFQFAAPSLGGSYYIVIKHRNALETWSAAPVTLTSGGTYDFTTAANKAFGSNQTQIAPGFFAIYSGDISNGVTLGIQDGIIDINDYNSLQSGLYPTLTTYNVRDLTGDLISESADYSLIENNGVQNIAKARP